MANAATHHPVITIRVISVTDTQVVYANYYERNGRSHVYSATTGFDRRIISKLVPGHGYYISQYVDDRRTTHWTEAVAFGGTRRPVVDPIVARVQKSKAKPQLHEDFLDW